MSLLDRRQSSRGCSTSAVLRSETLQDEMQLMTARSKPKKTRRSSPRFLPLGSALISHLGGEKTLQKDVSTSVPFQIHWQQAVKTLNNVKHLLAGAMSAIMSKSATAPLERIKMEMQLKQRSSSLSVARQLLKDDGYLSFWKGNGINLLRVTPHKAVNFYSFYVYRTALKEAFGNVDGSGLLRFLAGAMAGSTATLTCFPLDVVRTRMLSQGGEKYATAIGTFKAIITEESFSSLYVGCLPAVLSTAASGAIFYGVYDLLKERYLRKRSQAEHKLSQDIVLSAGRTMLYGALAGAAAESMLYPLEVLRRRMQLQSMQATEVLRGAHHAERLTLAAATENGMFASAKANTVPALHRAAASLMRKQHFQKMLTASVEIYKMDGVLGFYQGFAPHICQVLPSAALSYYFYEACKRAMHVEE